MTFKISVALLSMIAAAAPISAAEPGQALGAGAPAAAADARYCLRVEAVTGTRIETVQCWTRDEWLEQDVDIDKDWAAEGVRVLDPRRS